MNFKEYLHSIEEIGIETAFEKAKSFENHDREFFSRFRDGWEVVGRDDLSIHPHPSLIPIYEDDGKPSGGNFLVLPPSPEDCATSRRIFPLDRQNREKLAGKLSVVPNFQEFKSNFFDIFTENQLRYLNWINVFAAGGGILACLQPIPDEFKESVCQRGPFFMTFNILLPMLISSCTA